MKYFGKKQVHEVAARSEGSPGNAAQPDTMAIHANGVVASGKKKRKLHFANRPRKIALILIIVAVACYFAYPFVRDYFTPTSKKIDREQALIAKYEKQKDIPKALVHAKKLLSYQPDNFEYLTLVADLSETQNPNEAKVYYAKLLDQITKVDSPDVYGKPISTYWVAAQLAEKAGKTEQAKAYYTKVIEVANQSDGYQNDLLRQSEAALKRLQ